jgi:long-chain acyl-CoA synthetase
MFQRMLALPEASRRRYDLSSLRWLLHGAAPCPVDTKRRMIEWLGPVIYEYYAASEGGGTYIESPEWLARPGSVGRPAPGVRLSIVDSEGRDLPQGETGTIYFEVEPEYRFVYFKDPEKTAAIYRGGAFTLGDMGHVDPEGYLFLTGRSAEVIISGGVNIYPAEIDDVLLLHPAVADVAVVGAPNDEWGEEVRAVVQPAAGVAADQILADELIAFCRARLSAFKCPRAIDFVETLPRLETGKVQRHLVRQPYWSGRARAI